MGAQFIHREDHKNHTTFRIDRPEFRNKINEVAINELRAGLDQAQRDGSRVIVITGTGPDFCTGGSTDGYPDAFVVEDHLAYSRAFVDLLVEMGKCAVPIVARINGNCLAGGTQVLNRCDLAVSVDSARFGLPELDRGLFPMMALATGIDLFPPKLLFELIYLGRTLSAQEALDLRIVNRICAEAALDSEIDDIVDKLASRSAASMRFGRQAYYTLMRGQTEARLEQARMELIASAGSKPVIEGARALAHRG
jgi:enoyl-CoA hydratase/carnithine racemase